MCNAIGVDPLASSHHRNNKIDKSKGGSFWTQMLGGSVNDFYFDLAVKVVEICRETRDENGGMISIAEVKKRVLKGKAIGSGMDVSEYVISYSDVDISIHLYSLHLIETMSYVQ